MLSDLNKDLYINIRDKLIEMVKENRPFDSVFFNNIPLETLRLKENGGPDNGKSLIWWLAWTASKGRSAEAMELIWLKWSTELLLSDFTNQAQGLPIRVHPPCIYWPLALSSSKSIQ